MSGYIRYGYEFVRANQTNFGYISRKGELFTLGKSSFVFKKVEKDYAEFSLLSGHAMEKVIRILETARKKGIRTVGEFVPFDYHLIRVWKPLAFELIRGQNVG